MTRRDLKLVREFDKASASEQFGYQLVDNTTVLERKRIPINVYSDSAQEPWGVWIRIYDFNAFQVLHYIQNCYTDSARTPDAKIMHFSDFENRDAIVDAHRALTMLGGNPPPLGDSGLLGLKGKKAAYLRKPGE